MIERVERKNEKVKRVTHGKWNESVTVSLQESVR